ncbi:MAG: DNA internalization-related competence protein ComEC/Rec2 [Clostridiales bacterium GWE2_32_10]|nr:MAG: DNA internalization-related competence protein ComEC/Rec2 [Clostridiales bacterium GWE2_32_10]
MKRTIVYCLMFYLLGNLFYQNVVISSIFVAIWVMFLYQKNKNRIVFLFLILFVFGLGQRYIAENYKIGIIEDTINKNYTISGNAYIKEVDKEYDEYTRVTLKLNNVRLGTKKYKLADDIQAYIKYDGMINVGDNIEIRGKFHRINEAKNIGQFDEKSYMETRKIYYKFYGDVISYKINSLNVDKFLNNVKQKTMDTTKKILPPKEAGFVNSMMLGDKNSIDGDLKKLYSDIGLSHIIAISGTHILVLCFILYQTLAFFRVNRKTNAILSMIFLIFYAMLTGGAASAVRAVIMGCVVLFADIIGRDKDNYSNLSFAALVLIIYNPCVVNDIGFLLSFAAVLGILTTVPLLDKLYACPKIIKEALSSSVAALLWTTPIVAYYFYEIPTYSLIANILVVPLASLLLIISIIGIIVGFVWVGLAKIIMLAVYYILAYNEKVATCLVNLDHSKIITGKPSIILIMIYYVFLILTVWYFNQTSEARGKYKKYAVDAIFVMAIATMVILILPKSFNIYVLDVGQGDSIFINTPQNKHVLIDGGGNLNIPDEQSNTGKNIVYKYMECEGIQKIDTVFVTHPDFDHIKGVIEIMDLAKVDRLILTIGKANETELQKELIKKANEKHVPIYYFKQGDKLTIDDMLITCIYPSTDVDTYATCNNDYSLVLKIDYKDGSMLFTGDIDTKAENIILEDYKDMDVDLLKIAHHGSKYATSDEFIETVKPEYAVVSVGKNNYGHPDKGVLDRLAKHTVETYITKEHGAIDIRYKNGKLVFE